jgi:hypothetical protein
MTQAMRLNMKFSGNLGLHVGIHLAWLPYNTFHWSMDWPKEQITGKSLSNGKINGFRFRFSCKPIHWTGASKQPECYMPSQGELNPAAQAIWIVNFQGYQIWGAGDLQTNLYKRSSGGSPWDKPATTIQLQRDFDRINLINDLYIYILLYWLILKHGENMYIYIYLYILYLYIYIHIIPYPSLQAPVHLVTSYKPTFPIVWGPPSCVAGGPNRWAMAGRRRRFRMVGLLVAGGAAVPTGYPVEYPADFKANP